MNASKPDSIPQGLISDKAMANLAVFFELTLNPTLGIVGLCANVINIAVFYKMGLKDGVTQNFFILSISDGVMAVMSLVNTSSYILHARIFYGKGGPESIAQVVYWVSLLFSTYPQSVSMITTVVIGVVRCCCVAMPLQVKFVITAGRQLAVIVVFSIVSAAVAIYAFAGCQVVILHNPQTNQTIAVLVDLKFYEYTLFSNITYYTGFVTVIICVIILSISLNRSSNFREKSTRSQTNPASTGSQPKDNSSGGGREKRVVKTVLVVSIVFIVCYVPTMTYSLTGTLVSEFSPEGVYRNANLLNIIILRTSMLFNLTVNIFIYYFYNTRYRAAFDEWFGRDSKGKKK